MKVLWTALLVVLVLAALLLGWHGASTLAGGLEGLRKPNSESTVPAVLLLLGSLELLGALLALVGLYRFARAWRLLPGGGEGTDAGQAIRDRARANLREARGEARP